jgi:hypothetical protein
MLTHADACWRMLTYARDQSLFSSHDSSVLSEMAGEKERPKPLGEQATPRPTHLESRPAEGGGRCHALLDQSNKPDFTSQAPGKGITTGELTGGGSVVAGADTGDTGSSLYAPYAHGQGQRQVARTQSHTEREREGQHAALPAVDALHTDRIPGECVRQEASEDVGQGQGALRGATTGIHGSLLDPPTPHVLAVTNLIHGSFKGVGAPRSPAHRLSSDSKPWGGGGGGHALGGQERGVPRMEDGARPYGDQGRAWQESNAAAATRALSTAAASKSSLRLVKAQQAEQAGESTSGVGAAGRGRRVLIGMLLLLCLSCLCSWVSFPAPAPPMLALLHFFFSATLMPEKARVHSVTPPPQNTSPDPSTAGQPGEGAVTEGGGRRGASRSGGWGGSSVSSWSYAWGGGQGVTLWGGGKEWAAGRQLMESCLARRRITKEQRRGKGGARAGGLSEETEAAALLADKLQGYAFFFSPFFPFFCPPFFSFFFAFF